MPITKFMASQTWALLAARMDELDKLEFDGEPREARSSGAMATAVIPLRLQPRWLR